MISKITKTFGHLRQAPEIQADCSVGGEGEGAEDQDAKVISLQEGRQDQQPQAGVSSETRESDLPYGF